MDEWNDVYERYGSLVWATVYRILANHAESLDCCQDVFAELLRRGQDQQVRDWPAILRWLATRRALDRLRRQRTEVAHLEAGGDMTAVPAATAGPEARANFHELTLRLKRELCRLPPPQAEAFWLLSVEQMSYQEIAGQLGVPTNQVGVLVHRARQRLREWLADLNPATQVVRSSPRTA
jgi:RNA polymerase sigma-70 factor (ECF subfamily)